MSQVAKTLTAIARNPANVQYADLFKVGKAFFGDPRQNGSSYAVFKTPWAGDPRVNIQNDHGKAKPYQVRQVLKAIERLKEERNGPAR